MEDFKLQIFEAEHRGEPFPWFVSLQPETTEQLRCSLARKVGLGQQTTGSGLLEAILDRAHTVESANAESEDFDLLAVLQSLNINPYSEVYINWDDFRTIDRMRLEDLAKHFDYVWYPGPDDVEIFDDSLSWLLSVDHSGFLRVLEILTANRQTESGVAKDRKLF